MLFISGEYASNVTESVQLFFCKFYFCMQQKKNYSILPNTMKNISKCIAKLDFLLKIIEIYFILRILCYGFFFHATSDCFNNIEIRCREIINIYFP